MSDTPKGHPKGLYVLFVTEMWERFSYYGMRALFILFMGKALLFDKSVSSQIYGSYTGLVYLTPLIGGYMADRYWGNRKSIIIGGVMMAIGQFFMFLAGTFYTNVSFATIIMLVGLTFLIFGNGFFKPNISTMVGQLYPKGDKRIDAAFTIFYMGINLGAFIAPLLCGYLGERYDAAGNSLPEFFRWGFLAACFGMILSVILFIWLKNKYIVTPEGEQIGVKANSHRSADNNIENEVKKEFPKKLFVIWGIVAVVLFWIFEFGFFDLGTVFAGFKAAPMAYTHHTMGMDFDLIGSLIFSMAIAIPGLIISDPSLTKVEKQRIWVIYIACFFVIFFWSAFEQAGASLTYFAEEQTDRSFFGMIIPASYFQSINAVAIVIFAPLFALLWTKLGQRNMEPASPFKQAMGLFLLAVGYVVIAFGVKGLAPGMKVSMMWLVALYTIHTFGELCLSPIGLSMVNKLAPVRLASLLMGVWFLANATANKFAGTLSGLYPEPLVPTAVVDNIKATSGFELVKKDTKTDDYKGQKVYSMEVMDYSGINPDSTYNGIKGKEMRDKIVVQVLQGSITKEKNFAGFQINDLFSFFMIFVFMAGIASLILFAISSLLVKMMNGVR
ncbi:MAG TPA: peptide MFS transporter [Bacteroidia bacterium]|jgi:POT family proton-dependent oligopeptide transporter|nr:peptide MFS transporter [Bacteroidia bacterium]